MGIVVDKRFEVLALAGEGGMGRVYRALDLQDHSIVALKVMREVFDDGSARQRFRREIDALTRLAHHAIVPYIAHGTTNGWPYLAMQWVDGEELRERLERGPLDVVSTVAVTTRLADALAHAHAHGIMHRDVKPSNVLLPNGALHEALLIDFGLARSGNEQLTQAGAIVGTPNYMAPEQIRNTNVSPAVDVFALGCVIYRCLVGAPPFAAHDATAVLARVIFDEPAALPSETVPAALALLVDAMLSKSPTERPQMDRVFEVVGALASGRHVDVSRVGARREKIGQDEQRVVSVIVAGEPSTTDADETLERAPHVADVAALDAIVTRFGGDMRVLPHGVVVILFKASSAATDLATRAAECALELERLSLPLALATGRADAGSGVPVGEAIDRALALAPAHGDPVRVDDVTAGLLDARFVLETDSRGTLLRGRRTPGALRVLLGKPTACVGRDPEIATLDALVTESANDSVARAMVVTAPAGAGKSRIRHELLLRMSARGNHAQVCVARGDSVSGGVPFGMAAQIVMHTTGIQEGDPRAESERKLLACAGDRRMAVFLGEIVQVHFKGDDDVPLQAARRDPMLMGDQMQRAFVDFLELECRKRPVLVIAEDIQWGDVPSMDALDAALRVCVDLPLTVLALARPEASAVFPSLWSKRGVQHLSLAPLLPSAAERLVRDCLALAPSHVVELIVQRAAGNAFFLEELIRAASEGRAEMPETIVAMIDTRLGALEDASRRILRAASIFGETFWDGSVRALVGDDAEDLGPKLDDLARREFLTRREGSRVAGEVEYTFRHALVRDGAYATLTKADRVLGHRLAAEWLEQVGKGAAHVIAEHFAKSGDARAASAYLRAAEQALESNDLATAIDCAQHGIDLGAVGEALGALHAVRASALLWRGDFEEFERAAAALVAEGTDVWWNAVERLVNAAGKLTHVDVVLATVERIDQAASAQTVSRHVALAIAAAVTTLVHLGRYESARRLLRFAEGDALAREGIPAAAFAQARARLDLALGDIGAFRAQMAFAREVYEKAGEMKQSCQCTLSSGYGALLIGRYEEAERELGRALDIASRLDVGRVVLSAKHNLGLVFLRLGRIEEAMAIESEALDLAREQKNLRMEGACLYYLSLVLHALGDFDAAEARALESVRTCEHIPPSRGEALAALARARIAKGDVNQATANAKEALDILEAVGGIDEGEPFIRLVYAEALHASGALLEARAAISDARTHLEARAQKIADVDARATFLDVWENARTLELAQRW